MNVSKLYSGSTLTEQPQGARTMTREQYDRLRELEALDSDGVPLSAEEYAELRDLMSLENAAFVAAHS